MGLSEADLFAFGKKANIIKRLFCAVLDNSRFYLRTVKGGF